MDRVAGMPLGMCRNVYASFPREEAEGRRQRLRGENVRR